MKQGIHPEYVDCVVTCTCGNTFHTRSTKPELKIDLCNECHPFYTGQQKLIDTGGRVQRFTNKFGAAREQVAAREAAKKAKHAEEVAAAEAAKKAEREAKAAAKAKRAAEYAKKAAEAEAKAAAEAEAAAAAAPAEAEPEAAAAEAPAEEAAE
ncbi:MAG: 50S ribosomal protein L31 [Denitrobacterium sp.]|jgi:large subunit ribosomal protein L31|nr:50S ribosomal protein L31 [Denitrobacterium sp.]MCI1480501.1 50S ribosomal protein L31 [Eggerthellaceae bacterium]